MKVSKTFKISPYLIKQLKNTSKKYDISMTSILKMALIKEIGILESNNIDDLDLESEDKISEKIDNFLYKLVEANEETVEEE